METARKSRKIDSTLAAILAHPLRCQILTVLDTRTATPKDLSELLGEKIGNVSYHVRCLEELDAIELVGTEQRRGATAHYYRACTRPEVSEEEFALLSPEQRQFVARLAVQLFTADAGTALEAGTLGAKANYCISRIPGYVDDLGWEELNVAFSGLHHRVFDILALSAQRMSSAPASRAIPFTAGLAFFEMPG
jgi:DNA-binding transcriptional ArsR family regulator